MYTSPDKSQLLKNFAIGFVPLFIFIVVDELYGTKTGLIVAIVSGLVYLIYYFVRFRIIEKMILLDTVLILIMGSVSLILDNAVFFKLKPALIELILVAIIGIHAFSPKPVLLLMGKRYLGDITIPEQQTVFLKKLTRLLFVVFLLHTILIVYTAIYSSKEIWAFVSGGLFYVLLGLILAGQWIYMKYISKQKATVPQEEWFDVLNEQGRKVGKAAREQVHGNPELIHPVVHLHIINKQGKIYLQKRKETKDLYPDYWDTAVGGHVLSGELIQAALLRETLEELGIVAEGATRLFTYIMRNRYESEFIHSFKMVHEGPFQLNPEEISEGRFWTLFEIRKFIGKNVFTPNFEQEFEMLIKMKAI